jgi:hypothetical protein
MALRRLVYHVLSAALQRLQALVDAALEPPSEKVVSKQVGQFDSQADGDNRKPGEVYGQPPAHWLEYIAKRAPHLLEPGTKTLRLPEHTPQQAKDRQISERTTPTPQQQLPLSPRPQPRPTPPPNRQQAELVPTQPKPQAPTGYTQKVRPRITGTRHRQSTPPFTDKDSTQNLPQQARPPVPLPPRLENRPTDNASPAKKKEFNQALDEVGEPLHERTPMPELPEPYNRTEYGHFEKPEQPFEKLSDITRPAPSDRPESKTDGWFEQRPVPTPPHISSPTLADDGTASPQVSTVHQAVPDPSPSRVAGWVEFQSMSRSPHKEHWGGQQPRQHPARNGRWAENSNDSPPHIWMNRQQASDTSIQHTSGSPPTRQPLWPELPPGFDSSPPTDWEAEMREWVHLQKLDREQKGNLWNESPF